MRVAPAAPGRADYRSARMSLTYKVQDTVNLSPAQSKAHIGQGEPRLDSSV